MAICPTAIKLIAEILKNRRKYYSVQVFMGGETRTMSLCPALINQKTIAAKRNRDSSFLFDLSHSFVYNVFLKEVVYYEKRTFYIYRYGRKFPVGCHLASGKDTEVTFPDYPRNDRTYGTL